MAKQRHIDSSQGLRYVGNGSFIVGVPARDLSPAEAEQYADAIAAQAASGEPLYVAVAQQAVQADTSTKNEN